MQVTASILLALANPPANASESASPQTCTPPHSTPATRKPKAQSTYPPAYHAADELAEIIAERARRAQCEPPIDDMGSRDVWDRIDAAKQKPTSSNAKKKSVTPKNEE